MGIGERRQMTQGLAYRGNSPMLSCGH